MVSFKFNNIHININSVTVEEKEIRLMELEKNHAFKSPHVEIEFKKLDELIEELRQRKLPVEIISSINDGIRQINSLLDQNESIVDEKLIKVRSAILWILKVELHILPANYFRSRYSIYGILPFDLPLGLVLGGTMGNGYYIIAGFLIGLLLSRLWGSLRDNEIKKQNRQLRIQDWSFSTSSEREYI